MNNKFDEFLHQNRSHLDSETPNSDVIFQGIPAGILKKKYERKVRRWQLFTVSWVILTAGYIGLGHFRKSAPEELSAPPVTALASLEWRYQEQVDQLLQKVHSKEVNREEYQVLFKELEYIEEIEQESRADIPLVENKERLAFILIDTYEKKINLLEKLLIQIERNERYDEEYQLLQ